MTQRNVARTRAFSPGSSARIAAAALLTLSLVGAGTAADAVQPQASQPAKVTPTAPPTEPALTAPSNVTLRFEVPAFTAVPTPKPTKTAAPKKQAAGTNSSTGTTRHTTTKKATPKKVAKKVVKKTPKKVVRKATKKKVVKHTTKPKKHVVKRIKPKAKKVSTKKKVRHVTRRASRSGSRAGGSIISIARSKVGSPYRYGATGPNVFDCSGFVGYVYRQAGKSLPRSAAAMYNGVRHVSSPRAGDIIFFINGGHATHAGIYAGAGKMYDAPRSGKTVGLHSTKYYNGAVRYGRP